MFKKLSIAVMGLLTSVATAGTMAPVCTPENVNVPCETKLWDFSAQALYFRSIFGVAKAYELETLPVGKEVKSEWNWGYRLEGSYHFNTGNDITVNWMHLSTSTSPTEFFGMLDIPALGLPPLPAPFELVNRNRINQVNAVLGQHITFRQRDKMRYYAGLQYANIQSTTSSYYNIELIPGLTNNQFSKFDNTDYNGWGPVVGVDYAYHILEALSITANGAGSILVGTNRYHAGFVAAPEEAIVEQVFYRKNGIVPSLEAKLGLNYDIATPYCIANIQAGYQVVNYFNVLEEQPLPNLAGPVRSVDYGLFGPYFGLKLVGDA
ncbi:MAG: Lpg1974 family pore-forming outer membrane protein [Legionella sp.]